MYELFEYVTIANQGDNLIRGVNNIAHEYSGQLRTLLWLEGDLASFAEWMATQSLPLRLAPGFLESGFHFRKQFNIDKSVFMRGRSFTMRKIGARMPLSTTFLCGQTRAIASVCRLDIVAKFDVW